jgi:hypothetical protein
MALIGNLLEAISFDNGPQPDGKKVVVGLEYYRTVVPNDKEAVAVIEPDLKKGPWIAGGAPLRWYQGLAVGDSDIDVFCRDEIQAQETIDRIKSYGRFVVKHESDNALTLGYRSIGEWQDRWIIQIIKRRYFKSLQDVIDNFDITVCQIGTTGNEWVMNADTARDIREHNLRFSQPLHADAAKRLTKYWTYGYRPVEGTLEAIQNNPDSVWKFTETGDYENAF